MKVQSKKYQLARKCNTQFKNSHHLKSLPSRIEEETFCDTFLAEKEQNIFNQNNQPQENSAEMIEQTGYRYVGIKELKSYQSRNDKKKRNLNSFNKRSSDTALSFSRVSTTKPPQLCHLSKQDLIDQLLVYKSSLSTEKGQQVYIQDSKLLFSTIQLQDSGRLNKNKTIQMNECHSVGDIRNLKNMRKKYENIWNKVIKDRLKHQQKGHKKYRSILQNVTSFRQKVQLKERHNQIQKAMNIKPKDWETILHQQKSLKKIHQRQITKISSSIKVVGFRKKLKEIAWVQEKDKEGCFFKVASNIASPRVLA